MKKVLKLLGFLALVAAPLNHASAASITEDLTFSYASNAPFTIEPFNLAFQTFGSGNLLAGFTPAASYGPGSGVVFNEIVTLNTADTYTLSFTAVFAGGSFNGGGSIVPNGTVQSIGSFSAPGATFYAAGVGLSPVPLPASFPLFAMALIGLGMFGFHKARAGKTANTAFASV
jgi:hypothetical protein